MQMEVAKVLDQRNLSDHYHELVLLAPGIAPQVQPGQFVHMRVPRLEACVLRRPFSVFKTDGHRLHIVYKDVGKGTTSLTLARPGEEISLIGPLGHGFPLSNESKLPLLVAGGYGMAALYMLGRALPRKGIAFFGGRSEQDILCVEEFRALGWEVRIATDDGTMGEKGLVTQLIDSWIEKEVCARVPEFFACGPNGMLKAVTERALKGNWTAWLSIDRSMACGVGACLTCVQKIRTSDGGWMWQRVCREGPVFECRQVVWEGDEAELLQSEAMESATVIDHRTGQA